MKEMNLSQVIEKAKEEVIKFKYAIGTIKIYNFCFNEIKKYHEHINMEFFDYNVTINFIKEKFKLNQTSLEYRNRYIRLYLRTCKILDEINNGNDIKKKYNYNNEVNIENDNYKNIFQLFSFYMNNIGFSNNNKTRILKVNKQLLIFLEKNKINNFKLINYNILLQFINNMPNNIATRNLYFYYLRVFFDFLYENNYIEKKLSLLIPNIKHVKNTKIPSIWNFKDIKILLNSIDKSTKIGKRDYAIIILAITTSMRGCDIVNLKISDINFKDNTISFIQKKTKNSVTIPLLKITKEAIKDYLLDARAKTNYNNVFLTINNPRPISGAGALTNMIMKYVSKTNLTTNQKRGIHSFRHTVLNYLFNDNETSIITITEISGHIKPESLQSYIKTDLKRLREFTLSRKDFDKNDKN